MVPNSGALGACFCMGSVAFDVKAGEITDMGTAITKLPEAENAKPEDGALPPLGFRLEPANAAMAIDQRVKDAKFTPATYRPVGKLPNYFGVRLDRMPEMAGVMRYDRDRIVDLTRDTRQAAD